MRKYKERIKEIWRYPYRLYMKSRLQNHDFEIISSNCIGGILYHDVGEQFRTPTINLIIPEFLKFISNLSVYLNYPLEPGRITKEGYPCCMCGDIEIIGVHYRNQEHLIHDWSKRVKRVTGKHIFVISTDNFIKTLNPQLHSRSATYIKRNGLLIRKITIKSSRPFQCAYHPLTP